MTPGPNLEREEKVRRATAESELFDGGSKMSGRSKCTAGGGEGEGRNAAEGWNRTPVTSILRTVKSPLLSHPHLIIVCVYI